MLVTKPSRDRSFYWALDVEQEQIIDISLDNYINDVNICWIIVTKSNTNFHVLQSIVTLAIKTVKNDRKTYPGYLPSQKAYSLVVLSKEIDRKLKSNQIRSKNSIRLHSTPPVSKKYIAVR